ncbi:MAG: hypothetical protein SGPRY_012283 [Prymnesium sp.]
MDWGGLEIRFLGRLGELGSADLVAGLLREGRALEMIAEVLTPALLRLQQATPHSHPSGSSQFFLNASGQTQQFVNENQPTVRARGEIWRITDPLPNQTGVQDKPTTLTLGITDTPAASKRAAGWQPITLTPGIADIPAASMWAGGGRALVCVKVTQLRMEEVGSTLPSGRQAGWAAVGVRGVVSAGGAALLREPSLMPNEGFPLVKQPGEASVVAVSDVSLSLDDALLDQLTRLPEHAHLEFVILGYRDLPTAREFSELGHARISVAMVLRAGVLPVAAMAHVISTTGMSIGQLSWNVQRQS